MTVSVPGPQRPLILLTGATGYVGGRLLHALEERGERVRCLSRRPEYLSARVGPGTEVVPGDVLSPETLRCGAQGRRDGVLPRALDGVGRVLREG